MLGNYESLWEAHSTKDELRARGGGGVVTALLLYALEEGLISKALVTTSSDSAFWAEPLIAKTSEEVISAAGSKYIFVPHGKMIKELGQRSALVGLPCQLALYRDFNFLKIGIFCGLAISRRGIRYLLRQLNVELNEIKSLDYRALGRGLLVRLNNGEEIRYKGYYWLSYFFSNSKCIPCVDNTNHYADISVGDRRPGWSSVVVRTEKGSELFHGAIETGHIKAKPVSLEDFIRKVQTPFFQKELKGGYINTKLVRVRGRWIEHLPLKLLRGLGNLIHHQMKKRSL